MPQTKQKRSLKKELRALDECDVWIMVVSVGSIGRVTHQTLMISWFPFPELSNCRTSAACGVGHPCLERADLEKRLPKIASAGAPWGPAGLYVERAPRVRARAGARSQCWSSSEARGDR